MHKFLAMSALTAMATAAVATPAIAAEPRIAPAKNTAAPLDILAQQVNFAAAAKAEGMAVPTHNYKISARFGQAGSMWSSGHHTGLDFAAPIGTSIDAADSGRVVAAEPAGAYGNMIEIAHGDGTRTRYAHLSDIDVKKGDTVRRGQHIGDLGITGNSNGPHLHFEVLTKGTPTDPAKALNL